MFKQLHRVGTRLPYLLGSTVREPLLQQPSNSCSIFLAVNRAVEQQAPYFKWGFQGQQKGHASAPAPNTEENDKQADNSGQQQQQQEPEKQEQVEEPGINYEELVTQLKGQLQQKSERIDALNAQVSELKDKVVRTLADMENLRERTSKKSQEDKQFAVQDFAVGLLDVADNLERAIGAVSPELIEENEAKLEELDKNQLLTQLRGLLGGVKLTQRVLMQSFNKFGVQKYESLNLPFDPALHNALFEVPDPSKDSGVVAIVTKNGYKMHERVIRPADVGVTRNSEA
eukprot:TRINITY_DN16486_c2_g1_i1.p1 TRINITY_DN16486_c2_g1~~TRINITY_DN16486_c2_g1_i1.p1  ORF type:complete len:318 (-),score=50.78 TRINITY_DN16486_c2_g1_i1:269-1126(-)